MKNTRATALIINDNSVIMIQRYRDGQEYFVLPGGSVEEDETAEQAVLRELYEETSIKAKIIKPVFDFTDGDKRLHKLFLCEILSGKPELRKDSPEFLKMDKNNSYFPRWVDLNEIGGLTIWPGEEKEFLLKFIRK